MSRFNAERPRAGGHDHLLEKPGGVLLPRVALERQIRGEHLLTSVQALGHRLRCCSFAFIVENDGRGRAIRRANRTEPNGICHQAIVHGQQMRLGFDAAVFVDACRPDTVQFGRPVANDLLQLAAFGLPGRSIRTKERHA